MTRFNTQLVHGLPVNDNNTGAVNPPIYNSSTYAFESVGTMPRWDYARSGNPTREFLEKQIAQLEHGTRGFAFGSGLAAIHAVLSIFQPGDRIIVGKNIYGGTYSLFHEYFERWGVIVEEVDTTDYKALDAAVSGESAKGNAHGCPAKAVYFEVLTNPLLQVNNVTAIAGIVHRHGAIAIVDNTFVTPYLQQTLALRMDRQQENARAISSYLLLHPLVKSVHYPGLPGHEYELASNGLKGGGAVLSFEVVPGVDPADVLDNLHIFRLAVSLGAVESLAELPCRMTHFELPREERLKVGITDELVRLAVGVEDKQDLIEDLGQAFDIAYEHYLNRHAGESLFTFAQHVYA